MALRRPLAARRITVALIAAITAGSLASIIPGTAGPASAATASCADTVLASMTASQRIGQLFMVALPNEQLSSTMWSTTYLQAQALRWGRQLRAAGVNLDYEPVADTVPPGTDSQNAPIGQLRREFGHYVSVVSPHVAAFIAGMRGAGVATTAKHFPGLGRVKGNTDFTSSVTDSVTTRYDAYLKPFGRAIASGTQFVMVSLATYTKIDPYNQAVFSPTVMHTILRGDLAFHGVVMSDSLSAAAVTW